MGTYTHFLIAIALAVLYMACFAYTVYLTFRSRLILYLAKKPRQDPWPLFRAAWWGAGLWCLLAIGILLIPLVGALATLIAAIYGGIKLLVETVRGLLRRSPQKQYWKENPPPKFQFSMLDLYVGIFVYGCTLAVFAMPGPQRKVPDEAVLALCLLYLMGTGIGFYVALDVLRRTKYLKSRLYRAIFIGSLMAYSSVLFPFTWMSWRGWLYAMWQRDQTPGYTNPYLRKLAARNARRRVNLRGAKPGASASEPMQPEPVPPPLPPLQQTPPLPPEEPPPGTTPSA